MEDRTHVLADLAIQGLDKIIAAIPGETSAVLARGQLEAVIIHFHAFREVVRDLQSKITVLQNQVDEISEKFLPTMMSNQHTKSIKIENVGLVVVNNRWFASMINRTAGFQWLRDTGNQGLIIETVAAPTLGAWGKRETLAGRPPPSEIFTVKASPYISIRTAGERDDADDA